MRMVHIEHFSPVVEDDFESLMKVKMSVIGGDDFERSYLTVTASQAQHYLASTLSNLQFVFLLRVLCS